MSHPTYPDETAVRRQSGLNTAALVLGIVSLVIPFVGIVTAPLGIIFAAVARKKNEHNGMGTAGMVTSIIAASGYTLWFLLLSVGVVGAAA